MIENLPTTYDALPSSQTALCDTDMYRELFRDLPAASYEATASGAGTNQTPFSSVQQTKPFNCSVPGCPSKGFNRPYELARHMRKHTRTQVFPCPIGGCVCSRNDKAPYRRDKLQSHLRKAHGNYRVNGAAGSGAASQLAGHAGSSGSGLTVRGLLDTFCSPISASSTTRLTRLRSFF